MPSPPTSIMSHPSVPSEYLNPKRRDTLTMLSTSAKIICTRPSPSDSVKSMSVSKNFSRMLANIFTPASCTPKNEPARNPKSTEARPQSSVRLAICFMAVVFFLRRKNEASTRISP